MIAKPERSLSGTDRPIRAALYMLKQRRVERHSIEIIYKLEEVTFMWTWSGGQGGGRGGARAHSRRPVLEQPLGRLSMNLQSRTQYKYGRLRGRVHGPLPNFN